MYNYDSKDYIKQLIRGHRLDIKRLEKEPMDYLDKYMAIEGHKKEIEALKEVLKECSDTMKAKNIK